MECPFVEGQKVVCIKEGEWVPICGRPIEASDFLPKRGGVYQIRHMFADDCGILLNFVEDPSYFQSFLHDRFRPLVERKTDISIFTKMLQVKELVTSSPASLLFDDCGTII